MALIPLDHKIKSAVAAWREKGYERASPVTQRLLEFWFKEEHWLKDGDEFKFWRAQREAIEALIYVYEVCRYHNLYSLSRNFDVSLTFDPTTDNWPKYCFKMATGSGKTFVMALAIVWQYFNRFFRTDNGCRYTSHFLLIAPNLIVLDRLNEAFEDNVIFQDFPFIPPEWEADFDLQLVYQSQVTAPHAFGTLYLTNVQQLYEDRAGEPVNVLQDALGPYVVKGQQLSRVDLERTLSQHRDLLVLNDEAHHVRLDDDLEWTRAIARLHDTGSAQGGQGLVMQLDFSATPYTGTGDHKVFFPHTIYDYPLAAAIRDQVVKRPKIGEIEHAPEPLTKDYVKRNRLQIDTGVEVFQRFQRDFQPTGKKPVLFVMADQTRNADKVGDYLGREHRLQTLVIHTDTAGVITKKDLEKAREAARTIDSNKYQAIVSVMMLKEGWDVKNVCVIVPLRSYESAILAEQTLGRGLRRMSPPHTPWEEKLIVIDHPRFRDLWNAEIQNEDLDIEITSAHKVYEPENLVRVDPAKMQYDLSIPVLAGGITRDVRRISDLDVQSLPDGLFRFADITLPKVMYREKDLLTQKTDLERELSFDYTDRYDIYLANITKAILSRCAASAQFAEVVPKVRQYIEQRLFDSCVDMAEPDTVRKLNHLPVREKIRDVFADAILRLQVVEEPYQLVERFAASRMEPFHTSEPVYPAKKTVFEALPYPRGSEYEKHFIRYLDEQEEVLAYTKVLPRMPLRIPYHDTQGYLRHYTPDFVAKTTGGHFLLEPKGVGWDGQEDTPAKVEAATGWCQTVSELTGERWTFVKVLQPDFERFRDLPFKQLVSACSEHK
ncbi:MAG: DEAD/DEAH box helicase family protein [Chloroflexota bacterium]